MEAAPEERGNQQETVMVLSLRSFERIGTFSFATGLLTVFGLFVLLRTEPLQVVLTFLIVGIVLILLGVVLLTFSSRMISRLKKEEREGLAASEEVLFVDKPPSYETLVAAAESDRPPGYDQVDETAKLSLSKP